MAQLYLDLGKVTNQEAADVYSEMLDRPVRVGSPEYRVMDDLENPSVSYDYPSLMLARRDYPDAELSPRLKARLAEKYAD